MGSAASFETNLAETNENQFFCHSCHRVFVLVNPSLDYSCPYCHSSFLEELTARERNSELIPYRRRSHGQLTLDQARRIANATAMLRLLETQLREELEHLQHAFEAASSNYEARNRKSNFTRIMKSHLRNMPITLDHLCGQPSCPICSEDFSVGEVLTRLPCSHLFHPNCVLPWLEHKQNCPICRSDLPNIAPSLEYLENFSTEELLDKLQDLGIEVVDRSKQRYFLVLFDSVPRFSLTLILLGIN